MDTHKIFKIKTPGQFKEVSLEIFDYQWSHNSLYRKFCEALNITKSQVTEVEKIPFLPIQLFKNEAICTIDKKPEAIFSSSGTTGSATSKHHVPYLSIYEQSFRESFKIHYGDITQYTVLALLPSYLERQGSSLIYMVDDLIKASKKEESGFYLDNLFALSEKLKRLDKAGEKVLLIGVSFALLDLVETFSFKLNNTVVMETGGMKGRRKELVREELHDVLKAGFGIDHIHSEYGMTELLSQAYSKGNGLFTTPPWMQIVIRDPEDALTLLLENKPGGINVIDLANVYSCPFIATQDLGKKIDQNTFEILGRFDQSDIRGCNLMVI